ncbi:hypothetical protein EXW59_11650 [Bacillus mycoides]|uniref:hypothetical protein n=1 Tax=Bacillus mycoides TaxID=1405 RepID=UPI001C032FDA|nr:hypothetical protein [Bacillus mycoides]QWH77296.1 hypothetical protein EXW59_11650 [Bacillus mycoides]QWI42345.1 hypothetical protein EXW55_04910 [Bacillus mycoides]
MCAKFSVDYSQVDKLEQNAQRLPNKAEKILNDVLKVKVSPRLEKSIMGLIPASKKKKKHAKMFKALSVNNKENLAVIFKPKPKFKYLVFPDLGVGTSIKNAPQHFMEYGVEKEINQSIEDLNKALIEEINKTLGGR